MLKSVAELAKKSLQVLSVSTLISAHFVSDMFRTALSHSQRGFAEQNSRVVCDDSNGISPAGI